MHRILIATSNPHKIEELAAILGQAGLESFGLDALDGTFPEPVEDADTFEGNAELKAVGYAKSTGHICLADDSGLEVDALNGEPGIHSARYGGTGDTRAERDQANNAKLLDALANIPDEQRTARFVCTICIAAPDGTVLLTQRGTVEGRIGHTPRGDNGFGYDPLFILPDGRTTAELPSAEKNTISHRANAALGMLPKLKALELNG